MNRDNLITGIGVCLFMGIVFFGGLSCGISYMNNKIEERLKDLGYYQINFKENKTEIRKNVYVVEDGKMISLKQFIEYTTTGKTKEEMIIKEFKFLMNPEDNDWKAIKEK